MATFAGSYMMLTYVCTYLNFYLMPMVIAGEMMMMIYLCSRIRLIGLTGKNNNHNNFY